MSLQTALKKLIHFQDLTTEEMILAMKEIMSSDASPVLISGFLVAMEMKGPSIEEILGATLVMREMADKLPIEQTISFDIVGTGGDAAKTFNISTTTAFVLAAAGIRIAKHGNRAVSSSSGSADVLEVAGIRLDLTPKQTKECIEKLGIGFLFAPIYHKALRHAALTRKELGIRTFLNLLGPLTNPANATHLMIGVYADKWLTLVANVLLILNCQHAMVIHSADGLDEISVSAQTHIAEIKEGSIHHYAIDPEQFGIEKQPIQHLQVENAAQSFQLMKSALSNEEGPARDIVLLNAGAGIYLAGLANSIASGIEKARDIIKSGKALDKLHQLIRFTEKMHA